MEKAEKVYNEREKAYDRRGTEIKAGDVLKVQPGTLVKNPYYVFVEAHEYEHSDTGHTTQLDMMIPHLHGAWIHNETTSKRCDIIGNHKTHSHLVNDPKNGKT